MGKAIGLLLSGTLVYHHYCANRNATLLSLFSDVLIIPRQLNVSVPVDPLECQISHVTACLYFLAALGGTNNIRTMFVLSLHALKEFSSYRKLCTKTNKPRDFGMRKYL
ncbi:Reticulon domain-containing protein [Raphanus sativus]|nr:Reticulon domain-containing protein [Raphanus sativus]